LGGTASSTGRGIAYADCAAYISEVTRKLRLLYGIRDVHAAITGAGSNASAGAVTPEIAVGLTGVGTNASAGTFTPEAAALGLTSTEPSVVQTTGVATGFASVSGGGSFTLTVEQRLSERPVDVRAAARALREAIKDQIDLLNASIPNEPESLARQNDFITFLRGIAAGLDNLADTIDRAIAAGKGAAPEPVLLGKAAKIANELSAAVIDGLERNRAYIMDCSIKFTLAGAGYMFLHACGVDGYIAGFVAALMNVKWSKGGKSKK